MVRRGNIYMCERIGSQDLCLARGCRWDNEDCYPPGNKTEMMTTTTATLTGTEVQAEELAEVTYDESTTAVIVAVVFIVIVVIIVIVFFIFLYRNFGRNTRPVRFNDDDLVDAEDNIEYQREEIPMTEASASGSGSRTRPILPRACKNK